MLLGMYNFAGCEEGWYYFYWPIPVYWKWNNVSVAWGNAILDRL